MMRHHSVAMLPAHANYDHSGLVWIPSKLWYVCIGSWHGTREKILTWWSNHFLAIKIVHNVTSHENVSTERNLLGKFNLLLYKPVTEHKNRRRLRVLANYFKGHRPGMLPHKWEMQMLSCSKGKWSQVFFLFLQRNILVLSPVRIA